MSNRVLIAAPVHEVLVNGLNSAGYECVVIEKIGQKEATEFVRDCVGIVTSTRLQIDKAMIDAAPHLKWIGRMGSGMEVIDVPYAQSKGVKCYSSPEGNSNAVAEHTLGMLLALNKNIIKSRQEVIEGDWKREANRGMELDGKTVGIIGLGNTGRAFARKLSGFDVEILAYDKGLPDDVPENVHMCEGLDVIFDNADIISFHVPLQEDTLHYVNNVFVSRMKKPFVLLNNSRGKVMDVNAVYEGLESGKILAAGLDVWEEEPISAMSDSMRECLVKTAGLPNVVVTPHIAGYTREALYKMSDILLRRIVI